MMTRSIRVATLVAMLGVSACQLQDEPAKSHADTFELSEADIIESGREIVEAQCMSCHAIGMNDQSPRADAPPLRTVLANYAPDVLAEDFREHVYVGHPDMPDFNFGPIGTDHVLAYLISIQDTQNSAE